MKIGLEDAGHRVAEAEDGFKAMAGFKEKPGDLVIVGLIMPEMDGLGTIRRRRKEYGRVGIIVISDGGPHVPADFLGVAAKIGADACLKKPIDMETLLQAIEKILYHPEDHRPKG